MIYSLTKWKTLPSYLACFVLACVCFSVSLGQENSWYVIETGAVPRESGFKMKDWFVWGGSVIEVEGTYHLFASRWPKHTQFPQGYMTHSEIVRATADNPLGPYTFQEVVLGKRDPKYWDAIMTHNPSIYKSGDTYVLYYNARGSGPYRQVGYATAKSITGPWTRSDQPIDFKRDANNPAAFFEPDGSVKLMWRDRTLGIYLATAPSYRGPYTIVNDNVWPQCKLEDFYLFKLDGTYHMICEDNVGGVSGHTRWGVHFSSEDGITNWQPTDPTVFYNHALTWSDGTGIHCQRRERPQLLLDEQGKITHLFTSVLFQGETWNQAVPISLSKQTKSRPAHRNVVIDADTGNEIDDLYAIVRALIEPSFKVHALNSAQYHTQKGAPDNTVAISQALNESILASMGLQAIAHPLGANRPLPNLSTPSPSPASQTIIDIARSLPRNEKLDVLVFGPMTNLASAILTDPSIVSKIRAHVMGLHYDARTKTWNKKEFNTNNDIHAMNVLLNTDGLRLNVMTATTSRSMVFYKDVVDKKLEHRGGIWDKLVKRWEDYLQTRTWTSAHANETQWIMWDIAIVEALVHPALATKVSTMTPPENTQRQVYVYTEIDAQALQDAFWNALENAIKQ